MPNIKAAKKAVRSSKNKQAHNLYWKKRFKNASKALSKAILAKASEKVLQEKFLVLQKALDKAAKEKVIHKNKASRVKSKYAKKISARESGSATRNKADKPATKATKSRSTKTSTKAKTGKSKAKK